VSCALRLRSQPIPELTVQRVNAGSIDVHESQVPDLPPSGALQGAGVLFPSNNSEVFESSRREGACGICTPYPPHLNNRLFSIEYVDLGYDLATCASVSKVPCARQLEDAIAKQYGTSHKTSFRGRR
jgi:hypothetical protein